MSSVRGNTLLLILSIMIALIYEVNCCRTTVQKKKKLPSHFKVPHSSLPPLWMPNPQGGGGVNNGWLLLDPLLYEKKTCMPLLASNTFDRKE